MLSALDMAEQIRARRISATEAVGAALERIDQRNRELNAFVHLDAAGALRAAREIDASLSRGEDAGPLAGVPFGVKDNEDCAGMPTSRGSLLFRNGPPATSDSVPVARLRAAGAIPLGKTAAAEFGLDGVTATKAWGVTRNPWNPARTPSGSSGGSAAAVAGGMTPLCTASDGGGSIRVPAAFTGLVGFKPTHGRVPRPNGMSDTTSPGVLTRTVSDTAACLDVICGPDEHDRMSLPKPERSYLKALDSLEVGRLKAWWSPDLGFAPVEPEVEAAAFAAARTLAQAAGLELIDAPLRFTNTYPDWARLAGHRLRVRLEREGFYPARLEDLSTGPRELVERYGHSTDLELAEAMDRIARLEREVGDFFQRADLLLTPTAASVAYAAEGPLPRVIAGRDASETNAEPFTVLANSCWNPSISAPAGLGAAGLPVGLMITGRRHEDVTVLRLARTLELAAPWEAAWTRLDAAPPGGKKPDRHQATPRDIIEGTAF